VATSIADLNTPNWEQEEFLVGLDILLFGKFKKETSSRSAVDWARAVAISVGFPALTLDEESR
jgi:hypothetical protein